MKALGLSNIQKNIFPIDMWLHLAFRTFKTFFSVDTLVLKLVIIGMHVFATRQCLPISSTYNIMVLKVIFDC